MKPTSPSVLILSRIGYILFVLLPFAGKATTPDPGEANRLFTEGRYEEAIRIWTARVEQGQTGAGIYYNIGLAESARGNVAEAILAFERALRFKPNHSVIRNALIDERRKIENSTIPVPPFSLATWYHGFLSILRPGYWALLGLGILGMVIFDILAQTMLWTYRIFRDPRVRRWPGLFGTLCLILAVLRFADMYRTNEAIVMQGCEVRQAPTTESPMTRMLHPGEKVKILDKIGDWYHVSLLNLDEGWLRGDGMRRVMEKPASAGL